MTMKETLENIRKNIENAQSQSRMAAREVIILGACKQQPPERILEAVGHGVRVFGENRVQEAEEKWAELRLQRIDCELHLIGPLQTNKVKKAVALFDVIQTIDREKLAKALAKEEKEQGRALSYYIQVDIGDEDQKAGVPVSQLAELLKICRELGLNVVGLMCVPPVDQHPAPHFALMRELAQQYGLKKLSMGMSNDYEAAIRMGSSCIRLGRTLFGEREA